MHGDTEGCEDALLDHGGEEREERSERSWK